MAPLSVREERQLFEQRLREEARAAAEQIPVSQRRMDHQSQQL
jgi:hypothetical protein